MVHLSRPVDNNITPVTMPRKKRQKWRNEKVAVMQAAKKAKATKFEVLELLTVSPESIVTKNDTKSKRRNNLPLTKIELD